MKPAPKAVTGNAVVKPLSTYLDPEKSLHAMPIHIANRLVAAAGRIILGKEHAVRLALAGDDSLSIIGSNSRNSQGQFYNLDITYKLHEDRYKRYKRLFDIMACVLILCLFPLVLLLNNGRIQVFKNLFFVFIGQKTWVGYGGDQGDFGFLPTIKAPIIKYPLSAKHLFYTDDHFKIMNIDYAKNYSIYKDIETVWSNSYKLGNK